LVCVLVCVLVPLCEVPRRRVARGVSRGCGGGV